LRLQFLVYLLIVVLPGPSTVVVGVTCWYGYPECSFASSCCHGHLGGTSQNTNGRILKKSYGQVKNSKMMRKTCHFQTPVFRGCSVLAMVNFLLGTSNEGMLARSFHMIDTRRLGAVGQLRHSSTMGLELTFVEVAPGPVMPAH
jgi:hypothetical protein